MKRVRLVIAATLLVGLALSQVGCVHQRHLFVVVVDLSDGIEADARHEIFDQLKESAGLNLGRGNTLLIMPVTGDAQTETQGQILRFDQKTEAEREAYNGDIRKVAAQVDQSLTKLQAQSASSPYPRSDILGAVRIAVEEIAADAGRYQNVSLILLSDGIQHNDEAKFETDPRLASTESARTLGSTLARPDQLDGVVVKIGLLRSADLRNLPQPRRETIVQFWRAYFQASKVAKFEFLTDGSSALRNGF